MTNTIELYKQPADDPTVISEVARELLEQRPFIDMHGHAGVARRNEAVDLGLIETMRPAGVTAATMCAVADAPLLKRRKGGNRLIYAYREPRPGECRETTFAQLGPLRALIDEGRMFRITEPDHLALAHVQPLPGVVLAIEGCDFLEGQIELLEIAHAAGVRSIQLVHYRINELGDIQTEPSVHGGLSAFGRDTVRAMNRLGIIVDLAHATEAAARDTIAVSKAPVVNTHSNLEEEIHPHPRFISPDYARMVADTGGVIGAWAAAFQRRGLQGLIDAMFRLIDTVGIDHVGIGTDMGAGAANSIVPNFARYPALPTALLEHGFSAEETGKVLAGNWIRVFHAVKAASD